MIKVLDTSSSEWDEYFSKLPENLKDIYFTRDYYKLQEVNKEGKGRLFIFEKDNMMAFYPFLLREIEGYDLKEPYYDIETAYGYGGPLISDDNSQFVNEFNDEFLKYCQENNIVAEFIRFHPLIKNEKVFNKNIDVLHNRTTVYIDLQKGEEEIWKNDISSKNRNMIRKAEKNNLTVEFNEDLNTFKEIYESTMDKVNADDYYYFSDEYYKYLEKLDNIYISIKFEDKVIASAIFMKCGEYFHYHLAGSRREYLKYSPNNLLLWEAIKYASKNGFKYMHFGGGLTDSLEDNLYKFKKNFSKKSCDFYIGKRVHNKEVYNYLVGEWEKKTGKTSNIILKYRLL